MLVIHHPPVTESTSHPQLDGRRRLPSCQVDAGANPRGHCVQDVHRFVLRDGAQVIGPGEKKRAIGTSPVNGKRVDDVDEQRKSGNVVVLSQED
jgi:hypothetical protein